jgi:hypothetical protein
MQPIPSAPGYHATEDGQIISPRGKVLASSPEKDGYLRVTVFVPQRKTKWVSWLVAEAFLGPKPPKHEVRHLNGDRTDNRAENIAYGTSKQNKDDARGHGTLPIGEQNGRAKMTADQVLELRRRVAGGQTQKAAAEEMGLAVSKAALSFAVRGVNWGSL